MDVLDTTVHLASHNSTHYGGRGNHGGFYNSFGRTPFTNHGSYHRRGRGSYCHGSSSSRPLCQIYKEEWLFLKIIKSLIDDYKGIDESLKLVKIINDGEVAFLQSGQLKVHL